VTTENGVKSWYNELYSTDGENSMRPYEAYSVFLDYLDIQKDKKLLDASCGTGFLLLSAINRGLSTWGIDISDEAVKIARNTSPESIIEVGKGEDIQFETGMFEYVTCLGALEHFLDMDQGLQEMRRVMTDSGWICIMVPNSNYIIQKFSKESGTAQQAIKEVLYTDQEWRTIFNRNGLIVQKVYQDKWYSKNIDVFRSINPIGILARSIKKIAWVMMPLSWTYQFIYILRKDNAVCRPEKPVP